jgi:hypothetical protein
LQIIYLQFIIESGLRKCCLSYFVYLFLGNSSNTSSGTGSAASTTSGSAQKRGGKASFFASLHPSRWTRGSGANSVSSERANNNSGDPPNAESHPGGSGGIVLSPRCHNPNAVLSLSYKEQVKAWLKEQSLAFTTKYCKSTLNSGGVESTTSATTDGMPKLNEISSHLRQVHKS